MKKGHLKTVKGITLIEVVVAFGLLLVFFLAITSLEVVSLNSMKFLLRKQAAVIVTNSLFDKIRSVTDKVPENDSGVSRMGGREYRWETTVADFGSNDDVKKYCKKVTVKVSWFDDSGQQTLIRDTVIVSPLVAVPSPYPQQ